MKHRIKAAVLATVGAVVLLGPGKANASLTFGVDPAFSWQGFMNVFELPSNGGAYVFGSVWGTADLTANFSGTTLTLGPNTVGDPSSFWYTPSGGPGATGNKIMDASFYVDKGGTLAGQTIIFTGNVITNTLVSPYTSVAFIKDFAPDFSSSVTTTVPLVNGVFNVSQTAINDPARHLQFGFETIGPDVWVTDVGPKGLVQIVPVPEPQEYAAGIAVLLGAVILLRRRRLALD